MKRDHDGRRLWSIVTATIRPFPGRVAQPASTLDEKTWPAAEVGKSATIPGSQNSLRTGSPLTVGQSAVLPQRKDGRANGRSPDPIEPNRLDRLSRRRLSSSSTIDLHTMNQDRARAALTAFVLRAHAEGERTVLVITGKGALGDGVLRLRAPEWLSEPPLRPLVAGFSQAHQRHGGRGALYVALKRRRP